MSQALDHGDVVRRSCTGQIRVNVLDVNDHCPYIDPNPILLPIPIPEDYGGDQEVQI